MNALDAVLALVAVSALVAWWRADREGVALAGAVRDLYDALSDRHQLADADDDGRPYPVSFYVIHPEDAAAAERAVASFPSDDAHSDAWHDGEWP